MSKNKVFECDNCGTMLEEGDDYVTVLAKVGEGLMFVNLRFCCTKCADEYAKAHSKDGIIGVMPCMSDIDVWPDSTSHSYIQWRYLSVAELADHPNNNWEEEEESWMKGTYEDEDEEEDYDEWEEDEPDGSSGYEE